MLRHVRATRYVIPFREGGSVPALVEGDDLGMYVVKLRGAAQGAKALVAELLTGELARAVGFRVPEIVLVDVDARLADAEPDPELAEPLERSAGINVGLDYLPGSVTFDPLADPAPDATLASRLVLFDAFALNVDRTPRNPNLLTWHDDLWLIDHGASLYFHHGWSAEDPLDQAKDPFKEVSDHVLFRRAKALPEAEAHLTSVLTDALFERVTSLLPDTWLDEDRGFPGAIAVRAAYGQWLRARRDALPIVLEEALRARGV